MRCLLADEIPAAKARIGFNNGARTMAEMRIAVSFRRMPMVARSPERLHITKNFIFSCDDSIKDVMACSVILFF